MTTQKTTSAAPAANLVPMEADLFGDPVESEHVAGSAESDGSLQASGVLDATTDGLFDQDLFGIAPSQARPKRGRGPAKPKQSVATYGQVITEFSRTDMFVAEKEAARLKPKSIHNDAGWDPLTPEQREQYAQEHEECKAHKDFDNYVASLHCALLTESLTQLLSDDVKADVMRTKAETLQWIFAEERIAGRKTIDIPFSFERCCMFYAIEDCDALRAGLLQITQIRDLLVGLNLNMPDGLPELRPTRFYREYVIAQFSSTERRTHQFPGC